MVLRLAGIIELKPDLLTVNEQETKSIVDDLIKQLFRAESVDWPDNGEQVSIALIDTLSFHGLASLVADLCQQHSSCSSWPDDVLSFIHDQARQEVAIEMARKHDLVNLLERMSHEGIMPLLIKGTALSYSLYPRPGLRPRCDTDMLIDYRDASKVAGLMKEWSYAGLFEATPDMFNSQTTFTKPGAAGMTLAYDVHRQISNNEQSFSQEMNYQYLSDRLVAVTVLGEHARTLNKVDSLLLACFHRARSFSQTGERLIWLYDIHLLISEMTEDELDEFYQQAKRLRIVILCRDAIRHAQEWFATAVPEAFSQELESYDLEETSAVYLKESQAAGVKNHAVLELSQISSITGKLRYLYIKIFPPADYMKWRYVIKKRYLLPLYYMRRIIYGLYVFLRP